MRVLANEWIVLSDGCRLSARIWMPEDAPERPVPAILEYIPYRKDDATAARDAAMKSGIFSADNALEAAASGADERS